ncbi:MAG: type 1 glutamine amidotransferase domain-containing protein [Acidimicrobiales bacterium]
MSGDEIFEDQMTAGSAVTPSSSANDETGAGAIGANDTRLDGVVVGFVVANEGVEQVELTAPWESVLSSGGRPVLIATTDENVQARRHLDPGDVFEPDLTTADAVATDYDALVLPGGAVNADTLRTDSDAVELVRSFAELGRPLAAICHAPWMLAESGIASGKHLTSWPSLRTDLQNAGASWTDEEVVVDGTLITSRKPDDLDAFCGELLDHLARR